MATPSSWADATPDLSTLTCIDQTFPWYYGLIPMRVLNFMTYPVVERVLSAVSKFNRGLN